MNFSVNIKWKHPDYEIDLKTLKIKSYVDKPVTKDSLDNYFCDFGDLFIFNSLTIIENETDGPRRRLMKNITNSKKYKRLVILNKLCNYQ